MSGGLGRVVGAGAAGLVGLVVVVAGAAAGGTGAILGASGANTGAAGLSLNATPANYLALYEEAATTCPGLSWTVLAAIGTVESANGTSNLPGVHSGANYAGAEGPLQFEAATFAEYAYPVPLGGADPPSPYDATDAVYAAARDLCANGARDGVDLPWAIYAYNHDPSYVTHVLSLADSYEQTTPSSAAEEAVAYAEAQVGTPYRWGAEAPGVAFDCSGLTQAAFAASAIRLPRTAQGQLDAVGLLPGGTPLVPGDLLFFGASPAAVSHVGIYIGLIDGSPRMIDAPHDGTDVRVEPFSWPAYLGVGRVMS